MDVGDAKLNDIAAAQLAVDGGIEHSEVAHPAVMLEAGADRPDVLGLKWRLRPDDAALVPRNAGA